MPPFLPNLKTFMMKNVEIYGDLVHQLIVHSCVKLWDGILWSELMGVLSE